MPIHRCLGRLRALSVAFLDAWRATARPQYQWRKSADGSPESIAALNVGSRATLPTIAELLHGSSATTAQGDTSSLCAIWKRAAMDTPRPATLISTENRETAMQQARQGTKAPANRTSSSQVLLETATVWACGSCGQVPVQILRDTGSQPTPLSIKVCRSSYL